MTSDIKLFQQQKVRTHWDEEKEKWFFSIIDVSLLFAAEKVLYRWSLHCCFVATEVSLLVADLK